MEFIITDCERQLSENDIEKVEKDLSVKFPESFKQHYLKFNGGNVDEVFWKDSNEKIEIKDFIPILYNRNFRNDQAFTLNGRTLEEWAEGNLPKNLIQFAMDWTGNYFCIDCMDGKVYYFVRDFNESISNEDNLERNSILIANSFTEFIDSLVVETEIKPEKTVKKTTSKKNNTKKTIKSLVKKIEKAISELAEDDELDYLEGYKKVKGASDSELDLFEKEWGVSLPVDFKELYCYKNGSQYPFELFYTTFDDFCAMPFYMLSLDEIRKVKTYFCKENKLMEEFDDFFSKEDIEKLDKRIKPYLFNKQWIPFAQMVGGSIYLMMDFDPSGQGDSGQIIAYVHDPDFIYYVCIDVRELLQNTINNLENGCYQDTH